MTVTVSAGTPIAVSFTVSGGSNSTGVVSGAAAFTDPAGRALTYSTSGTSDGGGTVTVDANTGDYTYIPTESMRRNATPSTTDTFTITASNGVNSTTQTITITAQDYAGKPVAGTPTVGNPNTTKTVGAFTNTSALGGSTSAGSSVRAVYASGSTIYAATGEGLSTSTNGGTTWVSQTFGSGPFGPANSVTVSGTNVYVGTFGGLWILGGESSKLVTSAGAGCGAQCSQGVGHTFVDVNNNVTKIYTAVRATSGGQPPAVGISTDGGNWFSSNSAGLSLSAISGRVNQVWASGTTVYAATSGGLGISTNGGASFTNKTYDANLATSLGSNTVTGVWGDGTTIYAATYPLNGSPGGLSISTDGGATFTRKTMDNGLGSNAVNKVWASGSTVYAATAAGLSISTDGGSTFTNKNKGDNGLGANTVNGVYVDGNTLYAATSAGLSKATVTNGTGVVLGSAAFTDPAGRALTYDTTGTSAGGGTVSIDAATGAFTFTPTAAQRLFATANTTDTFIIVAYNGVNSRGQVVTVKVAAA